jgi:uncharacterized membrane protein YkvA (DUF1232 family)
LKLSGQLRYARMARMIWKLPMYARVIWGLVRDPRTPLPLKGLLAAGLAYLVMPFDLIPDVIPIIGQADDLTVLMLVLDLFIANAPAEVRKDHMERAKNGTADLDRDLAKLRSLMGHRYDEIRDNLPELLERYGELRDPAAVKGLLARLRIRRGAAAGKEAADSLAAPSDEEWPLPVAAGRGEPKLN